MEVVGLGEVAVGLFEHDNFFAEGFVVGLKEFGLGGFAGAVLGFVDEDTLDFAVLLF